ncbi:hypothetical protein LIER_39061 [Lithospermum erythrorhizon]|uniref:Putative plant transposon protein domain-containing protein n=1 Tax=Lithospermum erythrorhizon TaxID=34254 RepID=A0AAV3QB58_LITER
MSNDMISGATSKLADIIGELTGKTLTEWPTMGQLQASSLSLKYDVLHKVSIANLVPTSNNTNVSEALGRMLYVMGSDQQLNIGKVIFDQMVDHFKTGFKLKPIGFSSLICSFLINQHLTMLKTEDDFWEDAKSLTIVDKLMKGKDVVDVKLNVADETKVVPEGEAAAILIKAYEEEQQRLESEIQVNKVKESELQAKIQALKAFVPPSVNDPTTTSRFVHVEPTADAAETSKGSICVRKNKGSICVIWDFMDFCVDFFVNDRVSVPVSNRY